MKKHIVLCGRRNVGKTTMTKRLMKELSVPVYGYQTSTVVTDDDGTHHIYMYPAGRVDGRMAEINHIGDCNTIERTVNLEVFDDLGVRLLKLARPDGVIVMDEIGFMETGSKCFCDEVLKAFDGDIPILATIKDTDLGAEYMDRIKQHPSVRLYKLTRDSFDRVWEEVLLQVKAWNLRAKITT